MNRIDNVKKVVKILSLIVLAVTALVTVLFIIHFINIRNYNDEWRVVTPGSTSTQVLVDIHPRGGATDSWLKTDTGLGTNLIAIIYDMVVTNNTHTYVEDWQLRINTTGNCYLNNGWCGTFEIHQFKESGGEIAQTLDLRSYDYSEVGLRNHLIGQDLLIPLSDGDYFIYHPDRGVSGEVPIRGTDDQQGSVTCGMILYSVYGDVDLTDYELSYKLHKSVWEGSEGRFYILTYIFLGISLIILGTIFLVSVRFEERFVKQGKMLEDTQKICCNLADSRDYHSKGHSERVAATSRMIAEKMGMDKSDCDLVYNAALLHNIGNVAVNEQILRKPGKLTSDEYADVKKHTVRGSEILRDVEAIPHAWEAALYHHERYDGTGYPYGKKEEEIPLIARIVAVADAYDAMSNDRPYRSKMMRDQIREELIKNRGTQFDPGVVTAFLDLMGERNL